MAALFGGKGCFVRIPKKSYNAAADRIFAATGFRVDPLTFPNDSRIHVEHIQRDTNGEFMPPRKGFFPALIEGSNGPKCWVQNDSPRGARQDLRRQTAVLKEGEVRLKAEYLQRQLRATLKKIDVNVDVITTSPPAKGPIASDPVVEGVNYICDPVLRRRMAAELTPSQVALMDTMQANDGGPNVFKDDIRFLFASLVVHSSERQAGSDLSRLLGDAAACRVGGPRSTACKENIAEVDLRIR